MEDENGLDQNGEESYVPIVPAKEHMVGWNMAMDHFRATHEKEIVDSANETTTRILEEFEKLIGCGDYYEHDHPEGNCGKKYDRLNGKPFQIDYCSNCIALRETIDRLSNFA